MKINRIEQVLKQGRKIVHLSSGLSGRESHFPAGILKKGFQKFLGNPLYQPDSKGSLEARKSICTWYRKRGFQIHPEQILLTSGTSESYFEIFKLLAKAGDEILFPNPSYPLFETIADMAEIKVSFYRLDEKRGWQIDLEDLESKINPKTRVIALVSPNNPTGSILSAATLKKVLEIAKKHRLAIISDEVFSEFVFGKKSFPRIATFGNSLTFTLNGLSKTYGLPGLKLSWIIVSGIGWEQQVEKLEHLTDTFLACNQIGQCMLPDIIRCGESFIAQYRRQLEKNCDLTTRNLLELKNVSFHKPEGGPFLFVKINGLAMNDEEFVIKLMKATGIFVHPGYFYDYDKELFILLSFAGEEKFLKKNIEKICKFIKACQVRR
jgi:alanine-synthesizing transaminase